MNWKKKKGLWYVNENIKGPNSETSPSILPDSMKELNHIKLVKNFKNNELVSFTLRLPRVL